MGQASTARSDVRIGLVGPVPPMRGGIAQYTAALREALAQRCRVRTVSFASLYPGWLYPGRGLWEPEAESPPCDDADRILHPFNARSWRQGVERLAHEPVQAALLPWWTVFWAPCFLAVARWLRRRDIRVVWICHNLWDHEDAGWKRALSRTVLRQGDAYLVHASEQAGLVRRFFPDHPVLFHPTPPLPGFPDPVGTLPRRAGLELLFFGLVRRYKGVDVLLDAIGRLRGEDVALSIVGEWWIRDRTLRRMAERLPSVEIVDRYVSRQEAAQYFARADAVILPYRRATGCGVVGLAYRYGKPVIASRTGLLADVVRDGVTGRSVEPGDPEALARAIREFRAHPPFLPEGIARQAQAMSWSSLADALLKLAQPPEGSERGSATSF